MGKPFSFLPFLLLAGGVVGCGSGMSGPRIEAGMEDKIARDLGADVVIVRCPSEVPSGTGYRFTCSAWTPDGSRYTMPNARWKIYAKVADEKRTIIYTTQPGARAADIP